GLSKLVDGVCDAEARILVEPLRHHQLGARAEGTAVAFDLDFDMHEELRRGLDRHGAEPERRLKLRAALRKRNGLDRQTRGHLVHSMCESEKCLRMRCVNSMKTGFAMTSSERGRSSGIGYTAAIAPGRAVITTTRSPRNTASGIEWVMSKAVLRVSI